MRISTIVKAGTVSAAVAGLTLLGACNTDDVSPVAPGGVAGKIDKGATPNNGDHLVFANRSVTPALVKNVMPGVGVYTLLSSDDTLEQTPNFIFGGSSDGAGLIRNADRTYTLLVNNEDNWAVSRITLDKHFRPVAGEYVVNSTNGTSRLCSATLATPEEHGFGPVFLTAGESGEESQTRMVNPFGAANTSTPVTAFGRWSAEQALPLPKTAFPGKTAIVIGDDDSGTYGGQLALYLSNTVGDLENGSLYVLARNDENMRERDMVIGQSYAVSFKQIPNQKTLTGRQINQQATALKAIPFGRVEDVDYRRDGVGREIYFAVTGQNNTGANASYARSKYGRIYKLVLDANDPTKGTLSVVLDGDDRSGPAREFQDPDNITVTKNYAYIHEDPNGYGDETHDARLYQYNLRTGELKVVLELDHHRDQADAAKYNVGGISKFGDWELSGMIDVSEQTETEGTFIIGVQAHTWTDARFQNADGGTLRPTERQGSQILVLRGLPR